MYSNRKEGEHSELVSTLVVIWCVGPQQPKSGEIRLPGYRDDGYHAARSVVVQYKRRQWIRRMEAVGRKEMLDSRLIPL